jgi:ketosteroid isomerase-like protein
VNKSCMGNPSRCSLSRAQQKSSAVTRSDRSPELERKYWAAVSARNVEIVRRIYEAWNSGELGLELFDPSFELHQTATMLDSASVFRGHDGLLQAVQELFSGLRDLTWEPDDFFAAPDGRVVVPFRFHATGRTSGVSVDMFLVHVWTLHNDLAIRCETYEDSAEALQAVGMRQ